MSDLRSKIERQIELDDKLSQYILRSEGVLVGAILKEPSITIDYEVDKKLLSNSGKFYVGIVDRLLKKNIEVLDEISFRSECEELKILNVFEEFGGWATVKGMSNATDVRNIEKYIDDWNKWNLVKKYKEKGILDINIHWDKILKMTSNQLVDYIEYQIADIDIKIGGDIIFEDLSYNSKEIEDLINGINIGIQYGKHSPLLNYLTLGVAKSNIYLYGGYTNSGKSSFIFENMILNMVENKIKCCVISNEQKSDAFKVLLQVHILTERLNYWKLNRKKIRSGKFTEEDMEMMKKAIKIAEEEYNQYLKFVKIYDYDTNKVNKIVKKMSKIKTEVFFYDTFKIADGGDGATWEKLLADSKELFKTSSKNDVALILSVQLALHSKNKIRFLDEAVLSNGKQIAEVVETGVYMRDLWQDEWNGEPYDVKPYKLKKDENGKFTNEREEITLDKNKKYKIMFLSKSRSDENGIALLYEFNGSWNKWIEIGKCNPFTKNNY